MLDVGPYFPNAADRTYLNTASMALGNRPASEALREAIEAWQAGTFDWVEAEAVGENLRRRVAALVGAAVEDLAFVAGASGGAATIAAQLPDGLPGANVVVPTRDFASNFVPWMLLQERGYELRLVEDIDGALTADAFASVVDGRTAVIATSLVQSSSGFVVDLGVLKTLAADAGSWLVLDASQALGSIEVDIEGVDALFSCGHKWLLGVRGMGYLYVRPELRDAFVPISPGWKATTRPTEVFYGPDMELSSTASKLDVSTPWFDPFANVEGLKILAETGIGAIEAHNRSLIADLEQRGIKIPYDPANRSPILSIELGDAEATMNALKRERIQASVRAGRLRISVHLYNTHQQMEQLARVLG